MQEMPRQQYLSRDDKGWKLRRRVPVKLQKLAGVTQWVERLSGASYKEACEKANVFGVKTDFKIKRLEAEHANTIMTALQINSDEPEINFDLTDHEQCLIFAP